MGATSQGLRHILAVGATIALLDLVADAPHDDAWMVPVAQYHALKVALPPVGKGYMVVVGSLAFPPAVEGLVDHEHAQSVAGIQEGRRGRVVGAADGVIAIGLVKLNLALLSPVVGCGAQDAVVVMHAAAAELGLLPVEEEAVGGAELDRADAEWRHCGVDNRAIDEDVGLDPVEIGRVG